MRMMENEECVEVCEKEGNMENENWFRFKWLIDNEYHYTFIVDNLPSAHMIRNETTIVKYGEGLPLG